MDELQKLWKVLRLYETFVVENVELSPLNRVRREAAPVFTGEPDLKSPLPAVGYRQVEVRGLWLVHPGGFPLGHRAKV